MTTTIKKRYKVIKSFIEKWQGELQALQKKCDHPPENVMKKHKLNTGNNSHWINFECLDCGKKWNEFD